LVLEKFILIMTKINKKKIEEFIRVDHAGERGAIKIYEGQLLALNTFVKDENLKKTIEDMKEHEKEHCEFLKMKLKKEIFNQQNFYHYGIY
jgi:ubiquinone biosynthesis monooxygenase Coq7